MKTYKINLKIHGSIMTPFQADTLFGHLCWIVAYKLGEKEIEEFLEPFKKGNPPFIISDGFPNDLLPKPLSADLNIDDPQERKEFKKIDFVSFGEFNSLLRDEKVKPQASPPPIVSYLTPHNSINRLTNSTLAEGGVYSLKETIIPEIDIYLKAHSEEWKEIGRAHV